MDISELSYTSINTNDKYCFSVHVDYDDAK